MREQAHRRKLQSPRQSPELAHSPQLAPPATLPERVGNESLVEGLSGELDGFGEALLAAEAALRAGLAPAADPFSSNLAMQRLMRHTAAHPGAPSAARLPQLLEASTGAPVPEAVLARMSTALGHDFTGVRLHTDAAAAQAARAIHARAFTVGREVYFDRGQYAPGTPTGDALLAHELTHVLQHDEGRLPTATGLQVSHPHDPAEREASAAESLALRRLQDIDQGELALASWATTTALAVAPAPGAVMPDLWDAVQSGGDTLMDTADAALELGSEALLVLIRQVSPALADLLEDGPIETVQALLTNAIGSALSDLFEGLPLADLGTSLVGALASIQGVLAGAAQGDMACCSAFSQWMKGLSAFITDVLTHPAIDELRSILGQATEAAQGLLEVVLAPQVGLLSELLGGAWSVLTDAGALLGEGLEALGAISEEAVSFVEEQLGLESEEDGLWGWLLGMAEAAWALVSAELAPVVGPLQVLWGTLIDISPLGQAMLVVDIAHTVLDCGRWLVAHWDEPDLIERAHAELGRPSCQSCWRWWRSSPMPTPQ